MSGYGAAPRPPGAASSDWRRAAQSGIGTLGGRRSSCSLPSRCSARQGLARMEDGAGGGRGRGVLLLQVRLRRVQASPRLPPFPAWAFQSPGREHFLGNLSGLRSLGSCCRCRPCPQPCRRPCRRPCRSNRRACPSLQRSPLHPPRTTAPALELRSIHVMITVCQS